ncbi:MAG: LysR substrate-binding domain-containing protein [Geminicoccaceae bacterium]
MQSLRSLLPSANALIVFEAAARRCSFTAAAAELGMTQASVSYAVKSLETSLGCPLFHRLHRRVELTDTGERFFRDVALALDHIRRSAEAVRRTARPGPVTFSTSTAFAAFWMVPRLARFRRLYPEIDLRLQATDRDVDLVAEGLDLGVRRGDGHWPGCGSFLLAEEVVRPVCSPAYLASAGVPTTANSLQHHTLIHLDETFRPRSTWVDWFETQGVAFRDRGQGLRLNDYALVLQAALAGQGIALGWAHLTDASIAAGQLCPALDLPLRTGKGFHIVWRSEPPLSGEAIRVREWLRSEAELD